MWDIHTRFSLSRMMTLAGPCQAPGAAPFPLRQYMTHLPAWAEHLGGLARRRKDLLSFMSWSERIKSYSGCFTDFQILMELCYLALSLPVVSSANMKSEGCKSS